MTFSASFRRAFSRSRTTRTIGDAFARGICLGAALVSVATTFGILLVLLAQAWPFFHTVSPSAFFGGTTWRPTGSPPLFGVLPLVAGTLMITGGAGVIALPIGLFSAVYLSEYASSRRRSFLKPALELLAGIPTVVYGYFGLFFVTPLLRHLVPGIQSSNAASGAIVVGIMILPLVSTLCEDALAAVPRDLRDGAYGLGATKMEVVSQVVIPAAASGILSAFILAISRALGETMAVTLAAGANPQLTLNPARGIETMTSYIVNATRGDVATTGLAFPSLFAVGLTLFAVTLAMNWLAYRLVRQFRRRPR